MLAHELRNPLAPIRNAVEILRQSGGDEQKVKPATEMMQRQVGQMVRLVDDLLDVSRISRGKIELRKEPVELASVVHHAVEAVRPLCESMDHELTVTLPPQPMYLNADPTRLAQVVGNLLNNACKFTEKGGRIRLTVEQEGEQAVIRVQDTGIGIAAEQLPRIFEMFTQVDTSLERSRDGLGIGLTLVKKLVEMHGGTVEARSAGVGQGSEFVVRLPAPCRAAAAPAAGAVWRQTRGDGPTSHSGRGRQPGLGRQPRHAVEAERPRSPHRPRRPRSGRSGGEVSTRRHPARHRLAQTRRLRSGSPDSRTAARSGA